MSASSGPGLSLMQEGISYMAGAELPGVIVDVVRGGPGLGNIAPEQSDYFCVVKGGGDGCYRNLVLAPASVQEMSDLTVPAFDLRSVSQSRGHHDRWRCRPDDRAFRIKMRDMTRPRRIGRSGQCRDEEKSHQLHRAGARRSEVARTQAGGEISASAGVGKPLRELSHR